MATERRLSFGDIADLYDRVRPSYPDALVDDVLAAAPRRDRALEIGAGTGKATALFAARGVAVDALEPNVEMAEIARRNFASQRGVTIEQSEFEGFDAGGRRYPLIVCAQAWHWISPEIRYVKSRELLEPGGVLALFWNRVRWESIPIREQLEHAYARTVPDFGPMPGPTHPSTETPPELWDDWASEAERTDGFALPEIRAYGWSQVYTTDQYLGLIQTHSDHIVLGPERLGSLLEAVGAVIDAAGGSFRMDYVALLLLARAD